MDQRKLSEGIYLDFDGSQVSDGYLEMHLTVRASAKLPYPVMRHIELDLFDAIQEVSTRTFRSITGVGCYRVQKPAVPSSLSDREVSE